MSNEFSERYWDIINSLIERGICSKDQWLVHDRTEFEYFWHKNKKGFRVFKLLEDVRRHMSWTKCLYDYAVISGPSCDIKRNRVFKYLRLNEYDPRLVGSVLVKWSRLLSERNTLWVSGDHTTCAYEFASALVHCSPAVGYPTPRGEDREENPFKGITHNLVYFWEGGRIPERSAPSVLEVFAGRFLPGDYDTEVMRTPCVVFANFNICSIATDDDSKREHYQPLFENCMYRLHFSRFVGEVVGCINKPDMQTFLRWAADNFEEVTDRHMLK